MLNGAGLPSVQAKWEEMFGVKEDESEKEEPKAKKTAKKITAKKSSVKKAATNKKDEEPTKKQK
jgi:hypothetical protein